MLSPQSYAANKKEAGSVLLEALIAVVIFSLGTLGMIGLQASLMKNSSLAKERIDASQVANKRIAELWVDRLNLGNYVETGTSITELPNGARTTAVNGDTVTITVTWRMPGQTSDNSFQTVANIKGN